MHQEMQSWSVFTAICFSQSDPGQPSKKGIGAVAFKIQEQDLGPTVEALSGGIPLALLLLSTVSRRNYMWLARHESQVLHGEQRAIAGFCRTLVWSPHTDVSSCRLVWSVPTSRSSPEQFGTWHSYRIPCLRQFPAFRPVSPALSGSTSGLSRTSLPHYTPFAPHSPLPITPLIGQPDFSFIL